MIAVDLRRGIVMERIEASIQETFVCDADGIVTISRTETQVIQVEVLDDEELIDLLATAQEAGEEITLL